MHNGPKAQLLNGSPWPFDIEGINEKGWLYIMSKIAVVYWSGTGNTEAMAKAVLKGAKEKDADVVMLTPSEFEASMIESLDAIAFGCPAMGAEVLEESEFEPMFSSCLSRLTGKKVALFGSYGWGDGEWMRSWEKTCEDAGVELAFESVICNEEPDGEAVAACNALGAALAE